MKGYSSTTFYANLINFFWCFIQNQSKNHWYYAYNSNKALSKKSFFCYLMWKLSSNHSYVVINIEYLLQLLIIEQIFNHALLYCYALYPISKAISSHFQ